MEGESGAPKEAAISSVVTFPPSSLVSRKHLLSPIGPASSQEQGLAGKAQGRGEHRVGAPMWACSQAMNPLLTPTHSLSGPSEESPMEGTAEKRGQQWGLRATAPR